MSGHRRGTYLTDGELAALERLAGSSGLTPSSVLRVGLRRLAGLPVPRRELDALGVLELGGRMPAAAEVHLAARQH